MNSEVINTFGNRLRLRVCGICLEGEAVLLINHRGIGRGEDFWIPPGGGVQFGESVTDALAREFAEETGLEIRVGELLFVNEFMGPPLHAVELFFRVYAAGGQLKKGSDPEMQSQIIQEVAFVSFPALNQLHPDQLHNLFRHCQSPAELLAMKGYYQFKA